MKKFTTARLTAGTARLIEAERLAEGTDVDVPEGFEATIDDATWLSTVALLVTDRDPQIDQAEAIEAVHTNQKFILTARAEGFEAWEVAAYAVEKIAHL